MSILSIKLNRDPAHIARIVSDLEQNGLVKKRISERDARVTLVTLTMEGEARAMLFKMNNMLLVGIDKEQTAACKFVSEAFNEFNKRFKK